MAAFWKLEGPQEVTWTPRVEHSVLTVSGTVFPLGNLERVMLRKTDDTLRRRKPGGWPGQASGVILLVALAWSCFLLFGVLETPLWIGPVLLALAAVVLLAYSMLGVSCPPFACLEIESSTGYVVRVFSRNEDGQLERLSAAVAQGKDDKDLVFSEEMKLIKNGDAFWDLGGVPDKVDVVR